MAEKLKYTLEDIIREEAAKAAPAASPSAGGLMDIGSLKDITALLKEVNQLVATFSPKAAAVAPAPAPVPASVINAPISAAPVQEIDVTAKMAGAIDNLIEKWGDMKVSEAVTKLVGDIKLSEAKVMLTENKELFNQLVKSI